MKDILKASPATILSTLLITALLCACGDPSLAPEEAIRDWVDRGQQAAERKDRGALMDMVSPAYADARGNVRSDLENMLRVVFLRQKTVVLLTRIEELDTFDDSAARLTLQVAMAGTKENRSGFSADAYRFEMELEHDGDDWLLISARWGQLGQGLR
jgi:hypothetical protein